MALIFWVQYVVKLHSQITILILNQPIFEQFVFVQFVLWCKTTWVQFLRYQFGSRGLKPWVHQASCYY